MRKRKTYILVITFLSCLYLLYRTFSLGLLITFPLFSVPQVICNMNYYQSNINETLESKPPTKCTQGDLVYGNFCVISPYSLHSGSIDEPSVTLTTQGTVEFLHHVVVLCRRWAGPISVAVYSPPENYLDARRIVDTLRDCDFCIRHWVSWHFFYFNIPLPDYTITDIPKDCKSLKQEHRAKKRRSKGVYPINVGRNIARSRTFTPFVFPIDIELYPSVGILPKFERMLRANNISGDFQVWVFPVFEVYSKYRAPVTKSDLRNMFIRKQVISFHQYRCDICHKIPNLTQWLNSEASMLSEGKESLDTLKVWSTVKRNKKYHLQTWEPFFIGTRDDPEFDVRLSWEGKQNKMQVAFEMCLMNYKFHIVENGFLVHSPGINIYNASGEKFRNKHAVQNNKLISAIRKNLIKIYGSNNDC